MNYRLQGNLALQSTAIFSLYTKRYTKVEDVDELPSRAWFKRKCIVFKTNGLPWLLQIVVLATYGIIFIYVIQLKKSTCSPCFNGRQYGCSLSDPIRYVFKRL